jgi:hypothetical protein
MEDITTNNNNNHNSNNNIGVLVNAKEEYTKQLISILKTCIYQGIKSIYMDAKDICHQDNTPDNVLMIFQDLLSRIPKWSQDIINKEFERITNVSKCDYIDDLLKVVYVSHIKILTVIHSAQRNKKLSLKVPSGGHFIHLCYIECAREFWKDPYLFSDRGSKFEQQKNMRDSETMIAECINETIRKQLPVRNILKDFLNEPDEDINEEEDTDIKEPVNKKYLKKLETVVKKELKSSNTLSGIDIELIRQVIREEMEGKPNTTVIKKELVDNVVEKIVEKTNEINEALEITEGNESNESSKTNIEKIIIENSNEMNNEMNNSLSESTEKKITTKETELSKEHKVKKEVKIEDKIEIIPSVSNLETKVETKVELQTDTINNDKDEEENVNISLSKILDDNNDDNNDDSNNILDDSNNILDDSNNSLDDSNNSLDNNNTETDNNTESDNTIKVKKEDKNSNKLAINNIDEVNLNLDELDNDDTNDNDFNEIDIDDLDSIDLNSSHSTMNSNTSNNSNEVKSNNDTKYIFFNDAK